MGRTGLGAPCAFPPPACLSPRPGWVCGKGVGLVSAPWNISSLPPAARFAFLFGVLLCPWHLASPHPTGLLPTWVSLGSALLFGRDGSAQRQREALRTPAPTPVTAPGQGTGGPRGAQAALPIAPSHACRPPEPSHMSMPTGSCAKQPPASLHTTLLSSGTTGSSSHIHHVSSPVPSLCDRVRQGELLGKAGPFGLPACSSLIHAAPRRSANLLPAAFASTLASQPPAPLRSCLHPPATTRRSGPLGSISASRWALGALRTCDPVDFASR